MNGPHDLGGAHGFGAVAPDPDEPLFHAPWERRALALTLAMGATGAWTIDMSRHARESIPPAEYLAASYYEIWIRALTALLRERGLVTDGELAAGRALDPAPPVPRVLAAAAVPATLAKGGPTDRPAGAPPRFAPGDRVRARNMHPAGHTRLPRYVRGRIGVVERAHGAHVFADANAHGRGEAPEHLYTVAFAAAELWGEGADPGLTVSVDAFEPYLEALPPPAAAGLAGGLTRAPAASRTPASRP